MSLKNQKEKKSRGRMCIKNVLTRKHELVYIHNHLSEILIYIDTYLFSR
jgi:hypothetical protein